MKRLHSIVFVLIFSFTNTILLSQTLTVKFTGQDAQTSKRVSLDSIFVRNITQSTHITLKGQDTVLILFFNTGIEGYNTKISGFDLQQNYPNPFSVHTSFAIRVFTKGQFTIKLTNLVGQQIAIRKDQLEVGTHRFKLSGNQSQYSVLSVSNAAVSKSIKLINSRQNGISEPLIIYDDFQPGENSSPVLKSGNSTVIFKYSPGDKLEYVGYSKGYINDSIKDSPSESKDYIFNFDKQPIFKCGSSFTINHLAGSVAPVTKTVTYGTVANIPGEPTKCWITQNLGADQQAAAVDDATEASAGWYWQFNRKQGYKHDGITRTPNSTWISAISDNSDWLPDNDPCSQELGIAWRIPTKSELENVDLSGSWNNFYDSFLSDLKMYGSGFLYFSDGSLNNRGSFGAFWSGTQGTTDGAHCLYVRNIGSYMGSDYKTAGYSIRCINDNYAYNMPTISTASISNLTLNSAICGGNISSDGGETIIMRGVCWSTSQNPTVSDAHSTDGNGIGSFVSNITGLIPNTNYYLRAYATNNIGTSYGNQQFFTTLPWSCGSSITVNHKEGIVAPVNKTVTYNTATNLPGEPTKCWITQNLGADQQAAAVDDATEASAGWYWQFNQHQGFKNDGTLRTPNTSWITQVNENLDWQLANDPCKLELGSGWRIPTSSEWMNVDGIGNWNNWNDLYNSGLKLHAAGYLSNYYYGSLILRGSTGMYWSSSQYSFPYNLQGWHLAFEVTGSGMSFSEKANGFSLRCIKD